jgi:hypothetical protein
MAETEPVTMDRDREKISAPLSDILDWSVSILLLFFGLLLTPGGFILNRATDRVTVAELVAEGIITSDGLTDAELIDVTYAFGWWGGLGLAVAGVLLAVLGTVYLVSRFQGNTRFGDAGRGMGDSALLGAIVSIVASAIPFSPVLGGGLAGFLTEGEEWEATKTGALSGVVASVPLVLVGAFVTIGLLTTGNSVVSFIGFVILATIAVSILYFTALSAIGGWIGARVAERWEKGNL